MIFRKKFYKIKKKKIGKYQAIFERMLSKVDILNTTEWATESKGDHKRYEQDMEKIFEILEDVKNSELHSLYSQVIFDQYIFADPWARGKYIKSWVAKVLNRESADFFPDPWFLYEKYYVH